MSSHWRTTSWDLATTYLTIALTVVSGFVLPPLYLQHVSTDMYGAWLASGNLLAWLSILDPGLAAALQQRVGVAHGQNDQAQLGEWIGAGVIIGLCLSIFVAAVGLFVGDSLINLLDLEQSLDHQVLKDAFALASVGTGLSVFAYVFAAINRGIQETRVTGLCTVIVNALSIALIAVLVLSGHGIVSIAWGIVFRGAGWLLGNSLYLFWGHVRARRFPVSIRARRIKNLFRLSTYTFLGRIGGTLANHVDSFVVARFLGPSTVTLFEMTRRAPIGARPFVERLSNAVMPSISSLSGEGRKETLRKVLSRLLAIMAWLLSLMIAGLACFNDDFVRLWLGASLFAGSTVNILILIGLLLGVVVRSLSNLCMALGNIEGNSVVTFIESLVFVVLLYVGVTRFGLIGVVVAPILAKLTVSAWYYPRVFGKLIDLPGRELLSMGGEFLKSLILAGALASLFWRVRPAGWASFAMYVGVLTTGYGIVLLTISARFRAESRRLLAAIGRRVHK